MRLVQPPGSAGTNTDANKSLSASSCMGGKPHAMGGKPHAVVEASLRNGAASIGQGGAEEGVEASRGGMINAYDDSDESTHCDGAWSDTASFMSDASNRSGGGDGGGGGGGGGKSVGVSISSRTGRIGKMAARRGARGCGATQRDRRSRCKVTAGRNASAAAATAATAASGLSTSSCGRDNDDPSVGSDISYDDDDTTTSNSDGDCDSDAEDPLEPIPGEVKLVPSMFPDRPPTVFFEYPKELGMARFDNVYFSEPLGGRRLLFKSHWERNSVKNAFYRAGFSRTRSTLSWTASWGKHPTREGFRNLNRFQKVNHIPGSWCIGRKDRLMRTLARHRRELSGAVSAAAAAAAAAATTANSGTGGGGGGGGVASLEGCSTSPPEISPDGFLLPADRRAWLKAVEAEPKAIWIVKPPASSCGRGIRVINRATAGSVSKSKKCLVQEIEVTLAENLECSHACGMCNIRLPGMSNVPMVHRFGVAKYIHNPMLIDGRKFDLRLYVLVTSMEPLRVYLFEEGLVRLSTKRYTLKNLRSRYTHLTNYSINKKSGSFKAPDDSDGQEATESTSASKWALTFFWKYLEQTLGKPKSDQVQRSIEDVVLRTMVAADGDMTTHSHQFTRHRGCCYELFGFDVLLDDNLKPWLLEVNISPSLFGSSALDRRIKGTLMADIFHLVGFRPFDRMALKREERREAKHIPGTKRVLRAVAGKPQDAWRRCQTPASINLAELGEDEWEVIRDTEDEQHRAGHFRILYPTVENVTRLWPTFRIPRFLNGVLARWVLTGGVSNLANRADIGLTAERLASLGNDRYRPLGKGDVIGKGMASATGTSKGRVSGRSGGGSGGGSDGRWEETTSNATTVVSAAGQGARLALGGLTGGLPWQGAAGARPASSATSRASRSSLVRRPLWRASAATTSMTTTAGALGVQPSDGGLLSGKRAGKTLGPNSGGNRGAARKGSAEKLTEVPRLQLHRVESRVIIRPSLLTLKAPALSSTRVFNGSSSGSVGSGSGSTTAGDRSEAPPRTRRWSSASSSRPSTGRSSEGTIRSTDGGVKVQSTPLGIGKAAADRSRGLKTAALSKTRQTPRRRSRLQCPNLEQATVGGDSGDFRILAQMDVGARVDAGTAVISPLGPTAIGNGACFPRPPCRAARHAVNVTCCGGRDPLPAFAAALLPSRSSRLGSAEGTMTSAHTLSGPTFRSRGVLPDSSRSSSSGSSTTSTVHSPPMGLLVDSRALTGITDSSTSALQAPARKHVLSNNSPRDVGSLSVAKNESDWAATGSCYGGVDRNQDENESSTITGLIGRSLPRRRGAANSSPPTNSEVLPVDVAEKYLISRGQCDNEVGIDRTARDNDRGAAPPDRQKSR